MPDDRHPPSIFAGLPKPAEKPNPQVDGPERSSHFAVADFQYQLAELHTDLRNLGEAMLHATPENFEQIANDVAQRLEPLVAASGMAISERVDVIGKIFGPILADTIASIALRGEVQRFVTTFHLSPVALSPAVAQAIDEEEEDEDNE